MNMLQRLAVTAISAALFLISGVSYAHAKALWYNGGSVQRTPHVHVIFWGSIWNEKQIDIEAKEYIDEFLGMLPNSAWQGILTQYFDETGAISPEVEITSYVDESVEVPLNITLQTIREEVESVIEVNEWSTEVSDQFMLVAPHDFTWAEGTTEAYGFHGYYNGIVYGFVNNKNDGCCGTGGPEIVAAALAHEYAEAVTDPVPVTGWRDCLISTGMCSGFGEIADICGQGELPSGLKVSKLWDNHEHSCSIGDLEPPQVYAVTEPATPVSQHEATIRGVVNSMGRESSYYFEYGTTDEYGTTVPSEEVELTAGWSNVEVEEEITDLEPNTLYHYRVVAKNSTGTNTGQDEVFKTDGNGDGWKIQETEPPSETFVWLRDVSCAASSECVAVGYNGDAGGATSQRWDGTEWKTLPNLSAEGVFLMHVSCTSASFCLAISNGTAAQRWDGEGWESVPLSKPAEAEGFAANDISCTSQSACVVVGAYKTSGKWRALSEGWDGGEWSLLTTPVGETEANDELNSVSCTAADSCTAIGHKNGASVPSDGSPWALRWDGSEWSALPQPNGPVNGPDFVISCTSASACMAVGSTKAEHWDGSEWSDLTTLPAPAGESLSLQAVSCADQDACIAVGSYTYAGETLTLAEKWDGNEWEPQRPPNPEDAGVTTMHLNAVSCTSPALCTATGLFYEGPTKINSFAERFAPGLFLEPPGGEFPASFSLSGEQEVTLKTASSTLSCTTAGETQALGGEGQFDDATSGTATLTLHNCKSSGTTCTTPGEEGGTIKTDELPFELVYLSDGEPGVVFLPNAESEQLVLAKCAFGLVKVTVSGNGVLGRVTDPALGEASPTLTIDFNATEVGEGEYAQEYTETKAGLEYGLLMKVGSGETKPATLEAEAVESFGEGEVTLEEEEAAPGEGQLALEPPGEFPASFSLSGEQEVTLKTASSTLSCTTAGETQALGGEGQFDDATSGTATLTLHNCKSSGTTCTTPGEEGGTIKTDELPFELAYLSDGEPGVVFLPNAESEQLVLAACAFGLVKVTVSGNGVLGRITDPALGEASPTLTIDFNATEVGEGEYAQEYTETKAGLEYGLLMKVGSGETKPATLEAEAVESFGEGEVTLTQE